ncbi:RNA polymerase sigma factor [Thalassomonas haliotis]|uniref:Sigma-70 family RNA polymerase sigma factor n=1 Tax=Thalassomonas haliotis TaxID=485448 RepID=A0ABY7VI47_9GAMM|nr:sigma-70 family RNA polymerase sigma factor [Thalassomonas haliotis]WDE12608.1 sigma-70 family RNA polymerase sigma factor [Thalassomonas haliotis]
MTTQVTTLPQNNRRAETTDDISPDVNADPELTSLLTLCQQGNKNAFSCLYQKTAGRLNGIAYRITRNADSANEVLQEAFIQIWQNRDQYQAEKCDPFIWLAAIVRYRAYDRLRYDKRRHQQDMVEWNELDEYAINIEELNQYSQQLAIDSNSQQALHGCLEKLEQKQSQSILMAYLYGYSREDISTYFDTPVNTIKSWLRRGLGRLQQCLNQ